ncbi:NAD-dependent epimerase/dehydratase family protein [Phenylobacterium kunshanense]|nr:NAD-dependent epimerase/dehydratase family protein [Phenylobacterium kunshanense]
MRPTRLVVIGASGFLGEEITALADADVAIQCLALTRRGSRVAGLESIAVGDLSEDGAVSGLEQALSEFQADGVINTAGSSSWSDFRSVRQAALISRSVLAASRGRPLVHVSSVSAAGANAGVHPTAVYARSKLEAEQVVRRAALRWPGRLAIVRLGQLGPSSVRSGGWADHKSVLRQHVTFDGGHVRVALPDAVEVTPVDQAAAHILALFAQPELDLMQTVSTVGLERKALEAAANGLGLKLACEDARAIQTDPPNGIEGIEVRLPAPPNYAEILLRRLRDDATDAKI